MSRRIVHQPAAREDLLEAYDFIARDNPNAAERFLDSTDAAFQDLAAMPGMGTRREYLNPSLTGLRSWRVNGYENWLIFYRESDEAIEIIRVIHGARDLESELGREPGDP